MARLKDTILNNVAHGEKSSNAKGMLDISLLSAGQNGFRTDLRGYVSNAAHVRRNLIAVLVEAPTGFNDLPNPEKYIATLKSLVELHANSIEGLNSTLTVEHVEEAVGGAGEMQETLSNVTRERSTPTFNWTEKEGKPINAIMTSWITNLMMDPETKVPGIMATGTTPGDILPDYHSMTVMFIEPDRTHTRVVEAWLCTNMQPKTAGEVVGSRDLTTGGELTQYAVEFTALTQTGVGVRNFAQSYLAELNKPGINPNLSPAFVDQISEDIKAQTDSGYVDSVNDMSSNAITGTPDTSA